MRDLESLRIFRSPDRQGGGGLDESNPGPRGRGPIRDRSDRAARSRIWEGAAPSPEPVEAREPLSGEGGGPRDESAPDRADRARERVVSEAAGGGAARRSRSFAPVASSDLVARPSRLVERVPGCAPGTARGKASSRPARLRARLYLRKISARFLGSFSRKYSKYNWLTLAWLASNCWSANLLGW